MDPFSQVFRPGLTASLTKSVSPGAQGNAARGSVALGVDGVVAGELHRPAVVVELPREEEGVGEAVALGRGVAVVLVRGDGVQPEAVVRRRVDRQRVVMAHQDRFSVARHEQLGRQRPVEGPEGLGVLDGHVRVEPDREPLRGSLEGGRAGNR